MGTPTRKTGVTLLPHNRDGPAPGRSADVMAHTAGSRIMPANPGPSFGRFSLQTPLPRKMQSPFTKCFVSSDCRGAYERTRVSLGHKAAIAAGSQHHV